MMRRHRLSLFTLLAIAVAFACGTALADDAAFTHDVATQKKPWTDRPFANDGNNFQFAVMSDRTGKHRPGVFESAVDKLNLMRPEFVVSVGDLIEGLTKDEARLAVQWNEFEGIVAKFDMPFFYVSGNHDIANRPSIAAWDARFGVRHYAFTYRNVLFIVLDTEEGLAGVGRDQVTWVKKTLAEHDDVRWTFVLMHRPIFRPGRWPGPKNPADRDNVGFPAVQKALGDRPYTVFAGHSHTYVKDTIDGRDYITLGTTGGGTKAKPDVGDFDHVAWVTMTDDGPIVTNLMLDGIRDVNVNTASHARLRAAMRFERTVVESFDKPIDVKLTLTNPHAAAMDVTLDWDFADDSDMRVEPASLKLRAQPGKTSDVTFKLTYKGDDPYPALPSCKVYAKAVDPGVDYKATFDLRLALDLTPHLLKHRPTTVVKRAVSPVTVDGNLDDGAWDIPATIAGYRDMMLERSPSARTQTWLAYDGANLYVAWRCQEFHPSSAARNILDHDDKVWEDDYVELMIDPIVDGEGAGKVYRHWLINPHGTVYDALARDPNAFDGKAKVAVGEAAAAWTVEMAIPWTDLGFDAPPTGQELGLLVGRNRMATRQVLQYPPLGGWSHRTGVHGKMKLAE